MAMGAFIIDVGYDGVSIFTMEGSKEAEQEEMKDEAHDIEDEEQYESDSNEEEEEKPEE